MIVSTHFLWFGSSTVVETNEACIVVFHGLNDTVVSSQLIRLFVKFVCLFPFCFRIGHFWIRVQSSIPGAWICFVFYECCSFVIGSGAARNIPCVIRTCRGGVFTILLGDTFWSYVGDSLVTIKYWDRHSSFCMSEK
jgi:hypothetical protein